jgi:type II secretory pathway component PulF
VNEPLGPFSAILLVVPATALWIAIRALYGRKRRLAADPMHVLLSLSSAIMFALAGMGVLFGLVGMWFLFIPLPIVLIVLALMLIDRTRRSEHRGLIWALAAAAQRGVPLAESARAYADETLGNTGARATVLAEALERGQPLADAVHKARLRMGTAMKVAVRVGERVGALGPAMRQQLQDSEQFDAALRDAIGRFFYLASVIFTMVGICIFMMLRIVPVFQRMFEEFEVPLPELTQYIIDFASSRNTRLVGSAVTFLSLALFGIVLLAFALWDLIFERRSRSGTVFDSEIGRSDDAAPRSDVGDFLTWWLFRPRRVIAAIVAVVFVAYTLSPGRILQFSLLSTALLAMLACCFGGMLFFAGFFPRGLPGIWRLFKRFDGALVMRALALATRRQLPLPVGLRVVADTYPMNIVSGRLDKAAARVEAGMPWCDSLLQTGLISRADAAVLNAAERTGNLDWALEETADSALRRELYRIQVLLQVLFPIALLAVAAVVFVFVVGLFLPLVKLIESLA